MRKLIFTGLAFTICILFVSCASNEEKAEKLIKKELSKSKRVFESYEPIEIKVEVAKMTKYDDPRCHSLALMFSDAMKRVQFMKDCEEAQKNTYSRREAEFVENLKNEACHDVQSYGEFLKTTIEKLDTSVVIGWKVSHRFRCKNEEGNFTIANYKYLIDKNFKEIIYSSDIEDDEVIISEALDYVSTHDF